LIIDSMHRRQSTRYVTPLSFRWWRDADDRISGARPTAANSSLPLVVGLATTLIGVLVLQVLLIAVAFGTADYDQGTPGLTPTGFSLWSAAMVAVACGIGAIVTASGLRRADVEERGSRRVAALAPGVVLIGIAINGSMTGAGLGGVLLIAASAGLAIALGSRVGSRRKGAR
jgi:hypothetical protein